MSNILNPETTAPTGERRGRRAAAAGAVKEKTGKAPRAEKATRTKGARADKATAVKPPRGSGLTLTRSSSARNAPAPIGLPPRAYLIPPEVTLKRQQLKTRRAVRGGLVAVAVVVIAACAGSVAWSGLAGARLADTQTQLTSIQAQQAQFADVKSIKSTITLLQAGQLVGDATEIDWKTYLTKLQATLPAGVTLDSVAIQSATPVQPFTQATTPLQGTRVASLTFTATSPTLPSIPTWLDGLKTLPGFVDATPSQVTSGTGTTTGYSAQVLMHINATAYANRFAANGK